VWPISRIWKKLRTRLGISRVVLVQPGVYGTDNRCLLDALRRLTPRVTRGIAVIDPAITTDDELHTLQRLGVVSVRVNLNVKGRGDAAPAVRAMSQTPGTRATLWPPACANGLPGCGSARHDS